MKKGLNFLFKYINQPWARKSAGIFHDAEEKSDSFYPDRKMEIMKGR